MCTTVDRNASRNPLDEVEVPHPMSKRWIPYKHSNGIAVYYHQNVTEGHAYIGGEYMVSSIVKGTPEQCLAALTHKSSTTTILGPATAVEVLSAEGTSQVLQIQLRPPPCSGLCVSFCAPRQAVVQQTLKKEPSGIQCLMFSSLPDRQARLLLQQQQQRQWRHKHDHHHHHHMKHQQQQQQHWQHYSCDENLQHHHHHCQQQQHGQGSGFLQRQLSSGLGLCTAAALQACRKLDSWLGSSSRSSSSSSSWDIGAQLWRPVLVHVTGGYTISGLEGFENDASPESLVTYILKVDLGGWLSEHWPGGLLHRPALNMGVIDQLIERMLTSVLLVKDEVEQQRFKSYPFALLADSVTEALHTTPITEAAAAAAHTDSGSGCRHRGNTRAAAAAGASQTATAQQQQQQQQCGSSTCEEKTLLGTLQTFVLQRVMSVGDLAAWRLGLSSSAQNVVNNSGLSGRFSSHDSKSDLGFGVLETPEGADDVIGLRSGSELGAKPAAAAAAEDLSEQLVGLDANGQPLRGCCNQAFWSELHAPGCPSIFKVRGPQYLADRAKVPAGRPAYMLLAVDLVTTPTAVQHLARFLPSVRRSRAASCFVVNMMVPDAQTVMNLVMTFGSTRHWKYLNKADSSNNSSRSIDGGAGACGGSSSSSGVANGDGSNCGATSSSSGSGSTDACAWSGFDHVLHRFIHAIDQERSGIFKMIPHIEVGSWLVKNMVGTTPVIMGRKLATTYHVTDRYVEVDIDVTTCKTAGYIVSSIRSVTTSMVVDLSYLLEGQRPCELPEELLGAVRFSNIDLSAATSLDMSTEIPSWPEPWEEAAL